MIVSLQCTKLISKLTNHSHMELKNMFKHKQSFPLQQIECVFAGASQFLRSQSFYGEAKVVNYEKT